MPPTQEGSAITNPPPKEAQTTPAQETGTHPVPMLVHPTATAPGVLRKKRGWLWGLGGLLAVALGAVLYLQPWSPTVPIVPVETLALAPATRVLAVNGTIAAVQSVDLRPLVSGRLTDVLVAEGDFVAAQTDLARIDAAAQQAAVRQAVAALDAAIVAQVDAQQTYDRDLRLGSIIAQTALSDAKRAVDTATQDVARMTALFDAAQIKLADYTIRAPIAGTVLALNVDPGQSVDTSTVLMTLADLSRLKVETDVDEDYATQIVRGQAAVLQLAGETARRAGTVSAVSQRVDAATGGLAVTLAFDEAVTAPVGLTVTANIIVDSLAAAITLPRAAIVTDADGTSAFVVVEGIAQRRSVTIIPWPAVRLIATMGLAPGDVVITDAAGITDGQAVSVVQP